MTAPTTDNFTRTVEPYALVETVFFYDAFLYADCGDFGFKPTTFRLADKDNDHKTILVLVTLATGVCFIQQKVSLQT